VGHASRELHFVTEALDRGGAGPVGSDHLERDLFVELALVPLLNAFPGDDSDDARKHVETCRVALSGERAHGSAGFYATFARKA
jgi:hypothetical protein